VAVGNWEESTNVITAASLRSLRVCVRPLGWAGLGWGKKAFSIAPLAPTD